MTAAGAEREREKLYSLHQQLERWKHSIAEDPAGDGAMMDDELDAIDEQTLWKAAEMFEADEESPDPRSLNRYDVTAPGQGYGDLDETNRRTRRGRPLGAHEVTFSEMLQKRYGVAEGSAGDLMVVEYENYDAVPRDAPGPARPDAPGDERKNLMKIQTTDDLLVRRPIGSLKPRTLPPDQMRPETVSGQSPYRFLRDSRMRYLPSVLNLQTFLNKFSLRRDSVPYDEATLDAYFCRDIEPYVQEKHCKARTSESLIYTFFVEHPLFLSCVFGRRRDRESDAGDIPRDLDIQRRVYCYSGFWLAEGEEQEPGPVSL